MLYFITEGSNIRIKDGDNDFKVLSNTSKCIDWTVYSNLIDLSIDETTFDGKNPTHIYFDGVASVDAAGVIASLKSMFTNLGSTSLLQSATVILTDAEIKTLPTTPVTIVAAQGADKSVNIISAVIQLDNQAGAYTADANSSLQLFSGNIAITSPMKAANALNNTGLYTSFFQIPNLEFATSGAFSGATFNLLQTQEAQFNNQDIYIADFLVGVVDYTGGNAANTLKVTVYYTVVDL